MTVEDLTKRRGELQQEKGKAEAQLQRIIGALILLDDLIKECAECDKANAEEILNKAS